MDPHVTMANRHALLGPQPWSLCLRKETVYYPLVTNCLLKEERRRDECSLRKLDMKSSDMIVGKLECYSCCRRFSFKCPLVHVSIILFKK